MFYAVISGFVAAACIPYLHRVVGERSTLVAALLPLALTVGFATSFAQVTSGTALLSELPWIPEIGLNLAFRMDGLSLLFALLISGIGTLVVLYTHSYLQGHVHQHRFVMYTLMFMASMLGVVLSDNILLLFIFWELTSFTSYLMIGFDHEDEASRKAALQSLLVTGLGGLFLLAGLVLMGQVAGSFLLSEILLSGNVLVQHADYPLILGLILLGAFTKSAQTPFHFWLPNAMQAPSPASAYLHSSTMVKAGVYLLARLSPVLAGTEAWMFWLTTVGALTMLTGAVLASAQIYLKRLLAYTTVAALGFMVMLLGIGNAQAVEAALVFLMAHACYKAALFLVAGAIIHETGEKDVSRIGGLFKTMPVTGMAALVAAMSMAGIPLAFGFVSKELIYAVVFDHPVLFVVSVFTSLFFVLVAYQTGVRPFFSKHQDTPVRPHELPWPMLCGPVVLGLLSLAGGLFPGWSAELLAAAAASAIMQAPSNLQLYLWHGVSRELVASMITLILGIAALWKAGFWQKLGEKFVPLTRAGPNQMYFLALKSLTGFAQWQTRILQSGSLPRYIAIILLTMCALFALGFSRSSLVINLAERTPLTLPVFILGLLMMLGALGAVVSTSRIAAVAALGVVGFSVALIYVFFGAPDLAMTQLVVEALGVVLLVSAFLYLPSFHDRSQWLGRTGSAVVAILGGIVMTSLTLIANDIQIGSSISAYFAENSATLGHGRNIVNVILVDFRALDTLGEITVMSIAGVSALALLKLRSPFGGPSK